MRVNGSICWAKRRCVYKHRKFYCKQSIVLIQMFPVESFLGSRERGHHFRILREAGLVRTRVAGTVHQNSLRRAELDARFPGLMEAILKHRLPRKPR